MSYNKNGYYRRAKAIQELTATHYEPGRHDRCRKWVWKKYIEPLYNVTYKTFLSYLRVQIPESMK
mgnify:CR=1 FL=1